MPTQIDIDSNGLASIIARFRIFGCPKLKHGLIVMRDIGAITLSSSFQGKTNYCD